MCGRALLAARSSGRLLENLFALVRTACLLCRRGRKYVGVRCGLSCAVRRSLTVGGAAQMVSAGMPELVVRGDVQYLSDRLMFDQSPEERARACVHLHG